jgi:hypothetical protein
VPGIPILAFPPTHSFLKRFTVFTVILKIWFCVLTMTTSSTTPTFTFPHPTLTDMKERPTNASIQVLRREVYANALSATPPVNGGGDGFLGVAMAPDAYQLHTGGPPFVMPPNPGARPAPAGTAAQAQAVNNAYDDDVKNYNAHKAMAAALRQQITAAVDDTYICALKHEDWGYGQVLPSEFMAHLTATYGTIQPEEIEANATKFNEPWDFNDPIEKYWVRVEACRRFAATAGEPILMATMVRTAFAHFEKSNMVRSACEHWCNTPGTAAMAPDVLWTAFKAHFNKAERERHRQITAQGGGYAGAVVTPTPAKTVPSAATTTAGTAPTAQKVLFGTTKAGYCHTHGITKNGDHTSATCKNKGENHKDDATIFNRMGGSNKIAGGPRAPKKDEPNE